MLEDPKIPEPAPPGAYTEMVPHPSGDSNREIELAIFKEHRFSFFFWLKWARKLTTYRKSSPPTLVTIDWHRDLAPPSETDRNALNRVEKLNLNEACNFAIYKLDPHNDSHLLSAIWMNLIDDVILLKNYGMDQERSWKDKAGKEHHILEFKCWDTFQQTVLSRKDPHIFLDIDIDYFIQNKVAPYQREGVKLFEDGMIRTLVDPGSTFFEYILDHLEGLTIATEPRYCGGIRNSNHILEILLDQLFTRQMQWKHL